MAAVPTFGLDSGTPAAVREKWVLGFKVFHGFGKDGKHLHAKGRRGADGSGGDASANKGGTGEDGWTGEDGRYDKSHCVVGADVLDLDVSGEEEVSCELSV